jgi:hypothetical protein
MREITRRQLGGNARILTTTDRKRYINAYAFSRSPLLADGGLSAEAYANIAAEETGSVW